MGAKLAKSRSKGCFGWHTGFCTNADLKQKMVEHIGKGDMVDVINFAAMIMVRERLFGESA